MSDINDTEEKMPRVRERTRSQQPSCLPVAAEQVGYCKPPKSGQFKKGRSGNPKGRPRRDARDKTFAETLYETSHEQVNVSTPNGKVKMSAKKAISMIVVQTAMSGNIQAIKLFKECIGPIDEVEVNKYRRRDPNLTMVQNMVFELLTGDPDAPD